MKTTIITCDYCNKNITNDDQIEIGSTEGQDLKFSNKGASAGQKSFMSRYHDLHFCSKGHFIKYFFGPSLEEEARIQLEFEESLLNQQNP